MEVPEQVLVLVLEQVLVLVLEQVLVLVLFLHHLVQFAQT
jgi:hypothetical protein